jgi:CHAT domain-containing protein/predicted negative regulator of RcsB-dependent stress response
MKKLIFLLLSSIVVISGFGQKVLHVADSLIINADYQRALAHIDQQANQVDERLSALLQNKKAEVLIHLGRFEDAEALLKSIQQKNPSAFVVGVTKTNQGFLFLNQGRNDLALEALQNALSSFDQANASNSIEASNALAHLGQVYKSTGKHQQAEEQLQMALTYRLNKLKPDDELIAASYNDLGIVYTNVDNDKALTYYEKALAIYEKMHGKEHPKTAIATINIGINYRLLELYGDAVNNFENALKIWEQIYPQAHPQKAFVLYNLGETYMNMRNMKAALGYYERALKMFQDSYGVKHPEVARVYNVIGNMELNANKFDRAIASYQKALQSNISNFNIDDVNVNPSLRDFYHGNVLLYSLLYKAEAFEARHLGKTLKFSDLTKALEALQLCDTLIDKLRQQSTNENDKIALGVIANEVYADGVRVAYESAQKALHKKQFLELAFYFAEKSKSAALLEAISDADAKSFAGIPPVLLEEEKSLKSAIALTAQKLSQKPTEKEEKYLREASFTLNRQYESFVKNLETQYPQYFNLKFNAASPSSNDLQNLLNDETAVLSFFIDEENSRLYTFLITKQKYEITERALPKEFDKFITAFRNGIYFNEIQTYKKSAHTLNSILIPKGIPAKIKDLVILPTGRLGVIPFEALLTKKTGDQLSYQSLPYLLNRFGIRYEFSAGLLLQKSKQPKNETSSIFLCAPVTFPEKERLNDLPGTENEVQEISKLFASKNFKNAVFTQERADETLVKSDNLKNFSILHFATHGVVDENDPQLSRIFLQNSLQSEDGNLFAGEIYNLELDANLVTLSACQTGLGKISKGEGVIGLSRALVYAGAKNIIVSFWSVADESTAELMKDFYKKLLETNTGYSQNLRSAKRSLIESPNFAAPYYWAPFILIGF